MDVSTTNFQLGTAGIMINLMPIPVGDGENERTGNRIRLMGIHLEVSVVNQDIVPREIRLSLVKRRAPFSASQPAGLPNLAEFLYPNEWIVKKDAYRLLSALGGQDSLQFRYNKRWTGAGEMVIFFGAGASDFTSGNYQLYGDTNAVLPDLLAVSWRCRVYYQDL